MQVYYYLYYALLLCSFLLFLKFRRADKKVWPIGWLMAVSFIVEIFVEYRISRSQPYYFIYHFFGPVEYSFFCFYFSSYLKGIIRTFILLSIPVFILISFSISYHLVSIGSYGGINLIIRGTLLMAWALICLFNLPITGVSNIFKLPEFWIVTGVILYYGGVFFMNGLYNGLVKLHPAEKTYYKHLHNIINLVFNYFLYMMFCTGILCLPAKKKLSSQ